MGSSQFEILICIVYETGSHAESKHVTPNARSGEVKSLGGGSAIHSSENGWFLALESRILNILVLTFRLVFCLIFNARGLGFSKHFGRRGATHGVKDVDGYSVSNEGKHPRRTSASYGSHEVPKFDFCMVIHCIFLFWFNKWSISPSNCRNGFGFRKQVLGPSIFRLVRHNLLIRPVIT